MYNDNKHMDPRQRFKERSQLPSVNIRIPEEDVKEFMYNVRETLYADRINQSA